MIAAAIVNMFADSNKKRTPADMLLDFKPEVKQKKRLTTEELVAKGERIAAQLVKQGKARYVRNDR